MTLFSDTPSLFSELKRIGIDDELAAQVSASLDPDHNVSKKDVLVMQEAIMQVQARTDQRYYELKSAIADLRSEMHKEIGAVHKEIGGVRTEMGNMHRQYWVTFGGLICTILTIAAINWYYHL